MAYNVGNKTEYELLKGKDYDTQKYESLSSEYSSEMNRTYEQQSNYYSEYVQNEVKLEV